MNYDPDLNLLYVGTGNSSPYDPRARSPAGGDNLYVSCIVALNPDTGRLVWHYQTTPGDSWDYTAVQKMILADLPLNGKTRQVIMQAPKNGFFYVLDRKTGELLSAKNYTYVNWATHVDMTSGRPVMTKQTDYHSGPKLLFPSAWGGHSWQPMSFDPVTRLVYIPVADTANFWIFLPDSGGRQKFIHGFFDTNAVTPDQAYDPSGLKDLFGPLPELKTIKVPRPGPLVHEVLRAWDPVKQVVAWEHETSRGFHSYDGGVLSTAGNLVFQGRGDGTFAVYAADTGKVLREIPTGSSIMAAPSTYTVNKTQYVVVQAGYGGAAVNTPSPNSAAAKYLNDNRILVFKLDGRPVPLPPLRPNNPVPPPPGTAVTHEAIERGEVKFVANCSQCHVFTPNITPNLTQLGAASHALFDATVLHGLHETMGMPSFADRLQKNDVDDIHAYLIDEQRKAYESQQKAAFRSKSREPTE